MDKKIVVLGAGYAGVLVAKKLEKKLKSQSVEIILIDRNPFHTMLTELHEVAAWRVDESSIRIELKKIFAGRKVNVVMDTITETDYENQQLIGKTGTYQYDYLVMASGCKPTFFGVQGADEHAFTLWSYEDAVRLREHIMSMFREASKETDPMRKKALLTFYVIGGGFTGVEMAGELAEFTPIACKKFDIDPKDVKLHLLDVIPKIMTFLPDKARDRAMKRLAKMGVNVSLETNVIGVDERGINFKKEEVEQRDESYTVIWTAGTEGSDIIQNSKELGHAQRSRGRVQTDKYLRSLEYPNVYIAGDNIFYIPEGEKEPVPQMVENCEHCAPVIAKNIVSEVSGGAPTEEYKPKFHGAMVCIGGRYGTAYGGLPGKFFVMPSFFAMLAKHFINMIYFISILGFNKVACYTKHEFFTIRDKRSFLGGHFSNRAPLFLLVPLRLFMGMYFLYYAYVRVVFDWLNRPQLSEMFHTVANQFRPVYDIPGTSLAMDFVFFNQIRFSMSNVVGVTYAWLQMTPMSWFLETFVVSSPGAEMFWQTLIVIFCILIGLSLMSGLFTSLSAFGALFYVVIIFTTTGLPFHTWWLAFAPFAFMFTGGRVLSLDYYVMPWLKERWKKRKFIKKWYLYND